ncbi:MAG: hypothetical protein R6V23_01275 [Bacteroidales bacterium]
MNYRLIGFLLLQLIFFQNFTTHSQEKLDSVYGLNPILYNGQIYSYAIHPSVKGNQYLINKGFISGNLTINKKTFSGLHLNYDIYNQEILLKFVLNHKTLIIKLCKEKITEFSLADKTFNLIKEPESNEKTIYQVFGEDKYKVLYHWEKELHLSNISGRTSYVFTKPQKTMYLQFNNQKVRFKNNRHFLSRFNKSNKSEIKKYLKVNGLNIKRISDKDLIVLINFCNTL